MYKVILALIFLFGAENISFSQSFNSKTLMSIADEKITVKDFLRVYNKNMPVGVIGRSSNNSKIREELSWEPNFDLKTGKTLCHRAWELFLVHLTKKNDRSAFING